MSIERKGELRPVIDLDGPDGNAFSLLGRVNNFCRQLDISADVADEIIGEMMDADYYNLVRVFNSHFGEYVTLVTNQEHLLEELK